jgi:hypothetical protein
MGTRTDPDAQIPGVEPSRSLDDERLGDKALHLASDQVGVRIRDVERELDLLVVLLARGLDELQLVCGVGHESASAIRSPGRGTASSPASKSISNNQSTPSSFGAIWFTSPMRPRARTRTRSCGRKPGHTPKE